MKMLVAIRNPVGVRVRIQWIGSTEFISSASFRPSSSSSGLHGSLTESPTTCAWKKLHLLAGDRLPQSYRRWRSPSRRNHRTAASHQTCPSRCDLPLFHLHLCHRRSERQEPLLRSALPGSRNTTCPYRGRAVKQFRRDDLRIPLRQIGISHACAERNLTIRH